MGARREDLLLRQDLAAVDRIMNPRRRPIDQRRERLALDRIGPELADTAAFGLGGHLGAQCHVLDVIADARIYGAWKAAWCGRVGVSERAVERWAKRRQRLLEGMELGARAGR